MTLYIYRGKPYTAKDPYEQGLFEVPYEYIPQILYALQGQKDRADYVSNTDWSLAYSDLCKLQWELLMGSAVETLQMEIRAMRGGDVITSDVRNPNSDPYTLPLETLAGLTNNLDLARAKLEEIRLLIESGGNSAEILQELGQIAVLLA